MLQKLNADTLKIDRSPAAQINYGDEERVFGKAMQPIAQAFDQYTLVEGGEATGQLRWKTPWKCDKMQGSLTSRRCRLRMSPCCLPPLER